MATINNIRTILDLIKYIFNFFLLTATYTIFFRFTTYIVCIILIWFCINFSLFCILISHFF